MGTKTLPQRVKDVVDFTYEYLIQHTDGITMNAKELFGSDRGIVTILVKRGIIKKTFVAATDRKGVVCKYKWVASMPPTKNLYASIAQELRDMYKHKNINDVRLKEDSQPLSHPVAEEKEPDNTIARVAIAGFSDQEIWDELKRRGYYPEGNRLVKKAYLD